MGRSESGWELRVSVQNGIFQRRIRREMAFEGENGGNGIPCQNSPNKFEFLVDDGVLGHDFSSPKIMDSISNGTISSGV